MVDVKLVHKGCVDSHPYAPMVVSIKEFLDRIVRFSHVMREGNRVANFLANLGHSSALGLHLLDSPPSGIADLLWSDVVGISFPRMVVSLFFCFLGFDALLFTKKKKTAYTSQ